MRPTGRVFIASISAAAALCSVQPLFAQGMPERTVTYADVADLSFSAALVALVRIDTMIQIDQSRSSAVRPGYGRFYIEAEPRPCL